MHTIIHEKENVEMSMVGDNQGRNLSEIDMIHVKGMSYKKFLFVFRET
jgi:hypothetical protein